MEEYNSYLFMVLAHEYLHSFGIVDEFRVKQMTYHLCSSLLGKEHPASIMAKEDPSALFPELTFRFSVPPAATTSRCQSNLSLIQQPIDRLSLEMIVHSLII